MRRSLIVGALLATTALTPARAEALPVLGFIQGAAATLFGSAVLGGTFATAGFISGVAGTALITSALGTLGGRVLLAVGLSLLSRSLQKAPTQPPPSERLVNFAQPVTYAEWVLGRTRKGGFIGFTGFQESTDVVTGTAGRKRHYSPILAAHPCEGIVTHYLDERVVEIDSDGLVTTDPMAGHYRIRPFLGATGQVADAEMVNAFAEVTSDYDFAGLTGAHIWAARVDQSVFQEVYPTGRQGAYTPVIDGHNGVYDPRNGGSTGFTRNAALLMAYWIENILGQSVDWDEVAEEADACDVAVLNKAGASIPKWQIDGVLSDDQDFEAQRAQMAAACDAWMYEREDGKVGFKVGRYIEPTITLTQADFLSINISEGSAGSNLPTEVAAKYTEPDFNWREWSSAPYVLDSGSRQVREEPALYMVSDHNQAARLNKRIAKTKAAQYRVQGTLGLMGYFLRGHRFVRVQAMGLDFVAEVGELWRNEGGLSFDLVANSVTSGDFDFDPATEEGDRPAQASVVNDNSVDALAGLTHAVADGPVVTFSWSAQADGLTAQVRYRKQGAANWQTVTAEQGDTQVQVGGGFEDGATYEYQGRNQTSAGRAGDWTPATPATFEATANTTAPAALVAASAVAGGAAGSIDYSWTTANDANQVSVVPYLGTTTSFGAATAQTPILSGPNVSTTVTQTGIAAGTTYVWLVPANGSGIEGSGSGPYTVTVA